MKDKNFENIELNLGVGLDDADLISYFGDIEKISVLVKIRSGNGKIIEFTFFDVIYFGDKGGNFITAFGKAKEKEILKEVLIKTYGSKIPYDHPYKLFQFLDIDENPYLEIVCDSSDSR